MEFEIINNSNNLTLINKDKIIDYECILLPNDKMSLEDLEKFLLYYKSNKSFFHQTFLNENNTKTLIIKEKDGWRPIEMKLVFKPKEIEDLSLLLNRKLDYILGKFDGKNENIRLNTDMENSALEKLEKIIENQNKSLENFKKIASIEEEKTEKFMLILQESLEKKEKNFDELFKKIENMGILEKLENPSSLKKFEEMLAVHSQKMQEINFDNKLNTLSSNFATFLTNFDQKSNNFNQNLLGKLENPASLKKFEDMFSAFSQKMQAFNFDNKLTTLSSNFEAFLANLTQKSAIILEKLNPNPLANIIYRTIDTYVILNSDNNDVNYSGYVYNAYNSSCANIEELKNSNLNTGVGIQSGTGSIIIHKQGTFSEMILGGNNNVPGGWNTGYWSSCNIVFYNNYEVVAVYKLQQGNSNGGQWNSFRLGFPMTRFIISGYCSFSKISFKQ